MRRFVHKTSWLLSQPREKYRCRFPRDRYKRSIANYRCISYTTTEQSSAKKEIWLPNFQSLINRFIPKVSCFHQHCISIWSLRSLISFFQRSLAIISIVTDLNILFSVFRVCKLFTFIHSFVPSFLRSFARSLVRSFLRSFIHSFIYTICIASC